MTIEQKLLIALTALKKIHNDEGTMWTLAVVKSIEPEWKSKWDLLQERDAAEELLAREQCEQEGSPWIDRIEEVTPSTPPDLNHLATFPQSGKS